MVNSTIKSKEFKANSNKTIVEFYPSRDGYYRKLNSSEFFVHILYNRGGLYFKGKIDVDRFIVALNEALHNSNLIFGNFHKNIHSNDVYVSYTEKDNDGIVKLEIEYNGVDRIETMSWESIVPNKILDSKMSTGFAFDIESLPISAFKLTILADGFAIGYYLNHSFFDQASIFYLFKYISHLYSTSSSNNNNNCNRVDLKVPQLTDHFKIDENLQFKDIVDARDFGLKQMGFQYKATTVLPEHNQTIKIQFNSEDIEKLKKKTNSNNNNDKFISTNDIIHAILLKIYSFETKFNETDVYSLRYACNMRKRCEIGEETIANFVHLGLLQLRIKEIRERSIEDIALLNRESLVNVKAEDFEKDNGWFEYMKNNNENPLSYMGNSDPFIIRVTNWTSFDYNTIQFDNVKPHTLDTPCLANYGVVTLLFDTTNTNEKVIITSISVPKSSLNLIKEFSNTSNLFILK